MPVDLKALFLHLQDQLATRLQTNRAMIGHPGAKGSATEEGWRQMLGKYLPKRYCVSKAFVIDADGEQSDEIDLVVYDQQYSPFLFEQDGQVFIPAESVYAVFEIKQTLDAYHVDYAIQKAASVRRLKRSSVKITHAGGKFEPRRPFPILSGLLTLDSKWKPPLGETLATALGKAPEIGRLDLLCALQHGSAEISPPRGQSAGHGTDLLLPPPSRKTSGPGNGDRNRPAGLRKGPGGLTWRTS